MLTIEDVARHWQLRPATVRARIRTGHLPAVRIGGRYRIGWEAVWACEAGPMPTARTAERYRTPLLTKRDLAGRLRVSVRTVERWIADGLPTRAVGTSMRLNRHDVSVWLRGTYGLDLDGERLAS